MKHFLVPVAAMLLSWLTLAQTAPAQTRFTQRGFPNVEDAYQSGLTTYYKTWADLNDAQKRAAPYPGDWYRFDVARGRMNLLERTWQDGSFDRSQLNDAINDVQFVLNINDISPADRKVLGQDLEQLRDIRLRYVH